MAKIICTGSLMDGLAIDLVKYAGLGSLSEIQSDLLWSNNTDISIVQQCSFAELVVTGDFDSFPGRSDEFYELETDNPKRFKDELKEIITDILNE
jgi:hypothetical protein